MGQTKSQHGMQGRVAGEDFEFAACGRVSFVYAGDVFAKFRKHRGYRNLKCVCAVMWCGPRITQKHGLMPNYRYLLFYCFVNECALITVSIFFLCFGM